MTLPKRGFSDAEAMAYVGVKRRTWMTEWRPKLVAIPQGSSLVFDRADLDRLFDEFKRKAAGEEPAANDTTDQVAHDGPRNGRPGTTKGATQWAKRHPVSTGQETAGTSTSDTAEPDFSSVVSLVMKKRKAGFSHS